MRFFSFMAAALLGLSAWAADIQPPQVFSAASAQVGITPDSLATILGDKLATQTEVAGLPPWPIRLADMPGVFIIDSAGKRTDLSLLYVSPSQMNVWIPPGVAIGPASVEFPFTGLGFGVGAAALRIVPVDIKKAAPGLFSVDGSGSGVAAAIALRYTIGFPLPGIVPVFTCDKPAKCKAAPIDLGVDAPVYLSLFGTGIRGASSASNVSVTIGNVKLQPTYAGPEILVPGLDQVNVALPLTLRGAGLVNVTLTVDGVVSNAVQIDIQ